jgi:hypothetical protein
MPTLLVQHRELLLSNDYLVYEKDSLIDKWITERVDSIRINGYSCSKREVVQNDTTYYYYACYEITEFVKCITFRPLLFYKLNDEIIRSECGSFVLPYHLEKGMVFVLYSKYNAFHEDIYINNNKSFLIYDLKSI